jgi:hypothetical protein
MNWNAAKRVLGLALLVGLLALWSGSQTATTTDAFNVTPVAAGGYAYTLPAAPSPATSLRLYANGIRLAAGTDYTLSSATITLLHGARDDATLVLLADFKYLATGTGTIYRNP